MSSTLTKEPPVIAPAPEELKLGRRHSRKAGLFDPELLKTAFRQSLVMLRPDIQWKNPVMFTVEVGTVLTLIYTIAKLFGYTARRPVGYLLWLDFWLVATLLFANFASAIAEARGTWGCGRLTRQVVISLLMLGTPFHKGESQTKNGSRGAKMVAALSSSYLCYNLSPSFPAQARQDDAECGGYAFALLQFHPEDAAGVELDSLSRTDYLDHESGVQLRFWVEAQGDFAALAFDCGNAQALAHGLEHRKLEQIFYRLGQRAEAIRKFFAYVLAFRFRGYRRNPFVGAQAQIFAGDVLFWNSHIHPEIDGGAQFER